MVEDECHSVGVGAEVEVSALLLNHESRIVVVEERFRVLEEKLQKYTQTKRYTHSLSI